MNLPLGKRRCKILKEIRQKIAEENDIAFVTSECKHKGDCAGTCPKCEAELRYLEKELEARRKLGKAVTVAGLAVTVALTAPGCKDTTTAGEPMAEYSSISSISSGEIIDEPLAGEPPMEYDGVPPMEYDYPSEAGAPTIEEDVLACSDELLPEQIMRFYDSFESMDILILPGSEQKHTVMQDDENGKLTESIVTILDGRVLRVLHRPLGEQEEITEVTVLHHDWIPEKPEADLEFWIAENVDGFDFSGRQERYGMMGGREYYGSDYVPMTDENGEQIDPEECVIYTITSYPDYSSKEQHITRITITDPAVKIYGLCTTSSLEEFDTLFESMGYRIENVGNTGLFHRAVKDKISFSYGNGLIAISVEVTNKLGIVF